MRTIDGEASWVLRSNSVIAALTQRGGHLSPVLFKSGRRTISLFGSPPWSKEETDRTLSLIMQIMRGDFFCMPFGEPRTPFRGETHPIHGETSNNDWELQGQSRRHGKSHLHVRMRTTMRPGIVDKHLYLVDRHPAVYCRHVLSQMVGPMSYGHHAILKFPERPSSGVISTGTFALGQVYPGQLGDSAAGSYASLKPGATFKSLRRVATVFGDNTDVSRYPARPGYDDLLMLQSKPVRRLGWSAVTFPQDRYVWFALKDTAVLPGTVMWFSNGGRHMPPWNGRHRNTLGLEEVCSYFHTGLAASAAANPHSKRGFKTAAVLRPDRPLTVNYIMAATSVPRGFDRVASISATRSGVRLRSRSGIRLDVRVNSRFLWNEAP
jgi:hypothetical protein